MTILMTILADGWLCVMLLLCLMIAAWWGELAGIRPGRDKSGLGGFAAIYIFLSLRWLGLAILLPNWSWLLVHTTLGVVSVLGFGRGVERVQRDQVVPVLLGLLGAWLPVPVLLVAFSRVHGMPITGVIGLLVGVGLLALLSIPYLRWRRDGRSVGTVATATPAEGEPPFK
jgi:hypothetical protein